jgi:hypothetical protein
VWAQRAERTGQPFPRSCAAGRELPGLVIDLDASIVALAAHPAVLAVGARPRGRVRPAHDAARSRRLTFQPDTTSGHRQNQHAGSVTMPILETDTAETDNRNYTINSGSS